ncbi:MAG: DUF4214 domain-containing protein [Azonexus sp.]|jgi:hypothetical protein|uniref:DUF4214 domain-containing protein n=1 Tax=Azonexus sp. TaxID=1872668 RepID=UPI00282F89D5|nr:DUF4214 domain-containing protein [Azonexus sp.]MDR0775608.1 DUF4214 domain-containing protein [Azonexus sp.]
MALTAVQIQQAYIAFFNRPADTGGMNFWLNTDLGLQDILNQFGASAEYLSDFAGLSNTQIVTKIYQNLLGRAPDTPGLNFWVGELVNGNATVATIAYNVLDAALNPLSGVPNSDTATVENKSAAAQAFTDALVSPAQKAAYDHAGDNGMAGAVKTWLASVNDSTASVDAAKANLDTLVQKLVDADSGIEPPTPGDGDTIWLGGSDPTKYGHLTKDTTFIAQTAQLDDNAVLDGRGGNNTMEATIHGNEAIAPTTKNIQKVVIRGQDATKTSWNDNNILDGAMVDADRMVGVKHWESKNSRVDVVIEDVRILDNQITKDITIAFRESDPGHVDFAVYFDQPSLRSRTSSSGSLNIAVLDAVGLEEQGQPLRDNPFNIVRFKIDGQLKEVQFARVDGASTPQDLANAITAAIAAMPGLAAYNIQVTLTENTTFWLPNDTVSNRMNAGYFITLSSDGHTVEGGGGGAWDVVGGLPQDNAVMARQVAANSTATDLVISTVILDYVGRGSMGGDLVIGGMSVGYTSESKGVQQFDISVERDSKLEVISSTNNTLQVVNLVNKGTYNFLGAYERLSNQGLRSGDLTVTGDTTVNTLFGAKKTGGIGDPTVIVGAQQNIDGAGPQQFNGYGFTDVQAINGVAFKGNLTLNAVLTENVVAKYMNLKDQAPNVAAADNVVFNYSLGAGNDKLDLAISDANLQAAGTTTREDFVLNIDGGAGDDVITVAIYDSSDPTMMTLANAVGGAAAWYQNAKLNANLFIDAGSGNDTINTMGSGDWTVKLGTGNDTYYADNTAAKAVWVFNTANQTIWGAAARNLANLQSGTNSSYIVVNDGTIGAANDGFNPAHEEMSGLNGLRLRVVLNDMSYSSNVAPGGPNGPGTFISSVVDVPTTAAGSYTVTDLQINQAIKKAINGDPVLGKLLAATDGPANTLVVTSLTDGLHVSVDLGIEFAIPTSVAANEVSAWNSALKTTATWTDAQLQLGRIASLNALLDHAAYDTNLSPGLVSGYDAFGPNPGTGYTAWYSANKAAALGGDGSYAAAFANDGLFSMYGNFSAHTSSSIVIVDGAASDLDVVVLSTGQFSHDTIKWGGSFNNGKVTVVNFQTLFPDALGADWLDFTAYGVRWLGVATLDTNGKVDGGNGWAISQDQIGLHTSQAGVAATALPTWGATSYIGDFTVTTGDKYVTLTRAPVPTATNDDATTLYKIELWTVNGSEADAYRDLAPGEVRDTSQLIGYVDLGRVIESSVDLQSILAHIDLF